MSKSLHDLRILVLRQAASACRRGVGELERWPAAEREKVAVELEHRANMAIPHASVLTLTAALDLATRWAVRAAEHDMPAAYEESRQWFADWCDQASAKGSVMPSVAVEGAKTLVLRVAESCARSGTYRQSFRIVRAGDCTALHPDGVTRCGVSHAAQDFALDHGPVHAGRGADHKNQWWNQDRTFTTDSAQGDSDAR
jgi:hypothetical protein